MSESLDRNIKSQNIFYSQSQVYLTQEEQDKLDYLILCLRSFLILKNMIN